MTSSEEKRKSKKVKNSKSKYGKPYIFRAHKYYNNFVG